MKLSQCTVSVHTYLLLLLSTLVWIYPLSISQFAWVTDLPVHYQWASQFERSLQEGILIPRWNDASNNGLGDATFLHAHPLYYYLVAALNLLTQDIWMAMRIVVAIAHWTLGVVIYHSTKSLCDARQALVCGIAAQWMPFMALQALFGQSFPVLLAMPLAALVIGKVASAEFTLRDALVCSLALAGTILSHVLVGFTVIACISVALMLRCMYEYRFPRTSPYRATFIRLVQWISASTLSVCLCAWYLVPAILGRHLINAQAWNFSSSTSPRLSWQNNFVYPWLTALQDGNTSIALQWFAPLPTTLIGMLVLGYAWRVRSIALHNSKPMPMALGIWLSALFFGSAISWPFWTLLGPFQQLQFPWRFVGVMSISASVLLGSAAFGIRMRFLSLPLWAPFLVLIISTSGILIGQAFIGGKQSIPDASWLTGSFGQPEYLPSGIPANWSNAVKNQVLCGDTRSDCQVLAHTAHHKNFQYASEFTQDRRLPVFFHPGWQAMLDGKQLLTASADSQTGLLKITTPPGSHTINVTWIGTPLEHLGTAISLFSMLALLVVVLNLVLRKPPVAPIH
jgi:hypothetical protein